MHAHENLVVESEYSRGKHQKKSNALKNKLTQGIMSLEQDEDVEKDIYIRVEA